MDTQLLRGLALVSAALVWVLLVRRSARRGFGAGPAFGLWTLPLLALLLPWLPRLPVAWETLPAVQALPMRLPATALVMEHTARLPWLRGLWLTGATLMLLRLGLHYGRLYRQLRPLPASLVAALHGTLDAPALTRLRLHSAGPAVLWAPRSLVLLPADFLQRFETGERSLVLRHEFTHLHRGDALWSLLAELVLALLWFHPLAWLARPRFRLDQELACDERVLRHAPRDALGYAHTLLHSVGITPMPALIPWLSEPQLKERLTMIERHPSGNLRRRAGYLALTALLAGSVFVAQATTSDHKADQKLAFNTQYQPRYPAAAIKGGEQGTVILDVLVHADGSIGTITYNAKQSTTTSADLIAAATDAAQRWQFNPEIKNGKPVEGYVRVPVTFSLTDTDGKTLPSGPLFPPKAAPVPPPPPPPPGNIPPPPPPPPAPSTHA